MAKQVIRTIEVTKTYMVDDNEKEYLIEVNRKNNTQTFYVEKVNVNLSYWEERDRDNRDEELRRDQRLAKKDK